MKDGDKVQAVTDALLGRIEECRVEFGNTVTVSIDVEVHQGLMCTLRRTFYDCRGGTVVGIKVDSKKLEIVELLYEP